MKSFLSIPSLSCIFISTCMMVSCSKSSSNSSAAAPTSDDAAAMVSSSLTIGSGGFADQADNSASMANAGGFNKHIHGGGVDGGGQLPPCGVIVDDTVTYNYNGANVVASCTHQWIISFNCSDTTLQFDGAFTGSYAGPTVIGSRSGTKDWVLSGYGLANPVYTLNGSYNSAGNWTLQTGNKNTFNTTVAITAKNVTISKGLTNTITGGTGTVAVGCTVSNGNVYNFTGTVVFNGDHTATLTINGNVYTILI